MQLATAVSGKSFFTISVALTRPLPPTMKRIVTPPS